MTSDKVLNFMQKKTKISRKLGMKLETKKNKKLQFSSKSAVEEV